MLISLDYNNAPQLFLLFTSYVRSRRRCLSSRSLVLRAASASASSGVEGGSSSRSTSGRRVYRQSQNENSLTVPVKQITSFVVPAGVFLSVTFDSKAEEVVVLPKDVSMFELLNKILEKLTLDQKQPFS